MAATATTIRVWSGTAWITVSPQVWSGTAWVTVTASALAP